MENQTNTTPVHPSITLGSWIVTILITLIPIVNIIMLFVWAFSSSTNPCKANWAKASLIIGAIGILFIVLFSSVLAGILYNIYAMS